MSMTFTCKCCYEELMESPAQYILVGDTETRYTAIYCRSCLTYIHSSRWNILKESLRDIDCLAELKRFCVLGLPTRLVHGDLSMPAEDAHREVDTIWFSESESMSAALDVDITRTLLIALMKDLRELQSNNVTRPDIIAIYTKYFKAQDL